MDAVTATVFAGMLFGFLAVPIILTVAHLAFERSEGRARLLDRQTRDLRSQLGFGPGPPGMEGIIEGMRVSVELISLGQIDFDIMAPDGMPKSVFLAASGSEPAVSTGDEEFDRVFSPRGPERAVRSCLDQTTRAELLSLREVTRVRLEFGHLMGCINARGAASAKVLLNRLAAVAARIRERSYGDLPLMEIVKSDPQPSVRLNCLTVLLEDDPPGPSAMTACTAVLSDADPALRLLARAGLPAKREAALNSTALFDALRDLPHRTAILATRLLASVGSAAERPLEGLWERACREQPDTPLEGSLLEALAVCGSTDLVPRLHQRYDHGSPSASLRAAAHRTIEAIQSRAAGAGSGQLSVSTADAGDLSLAASGDLSLAKRAPAKTTA